MDFGTFIGLIVAFGAIGIAGWVGGADPHVLFGRWEALVLIIGGTIGTTITSFPLPLFMEGFFGGFKTVLTEHKYDPRELIATLVQCAEVARREGLLAVEQKTAELNDDFLRKGLQLVIDGRDAKVVRKILAIEVGADQEKAANMEAVFTALGGYSPTLGIIGTVLGLIGMLKGLSAMAGSSNIAGSIGVATAQAFVATFYGIMIANLVWLPIANKIKVRTAQMVLMREISIEGILALLGGENPRLVEERLLGFLRDKKGRESQIGDGGEIAVEQSAPASAAAAA